MTKKTYYPIVAQDRLHCTIYVCCPESDMLDISFFHESGRNFMVRESWDGHFIVGGVTHCPFCGSAIPVLPDVWEQAEKRRRMWRRLL